MNEVKLRKAWPHTEVSDLYYDDILGPVDRIEALSHAVRAWSFGHEDSGGPIAMKDMNAVVILADYIAKECALVRSLEGRVLNGPREVPPINLTPTENQVAQ